MNQDIEVSCPGLSRPMLDLYRNAIRQFSYQNFLPNDTMLKLL